MSKPHHSRTLTLTSPKQRQGQYFEAQARAFLQAQGLQLIAQNWQQAKIGEIDLIMLEQGSAWATLVFVEVRQRGRSHFGDAALSITKAKQRKLVKTARYFLQQHTQYADYECRFDVITYDVAASKGIEDVLEDATGRLCSAPPPEWITGAFMAAPW